MLNVKVEARVVDQNGDLTWTHIVLAPSEDPDQDYVDVRLEDFAVRTQDTIMLDPAELRRALDIIAGERARFMAPEGVARAS